MAHEAASGTRFIVDLGKIKLPSLLEKQAEMEIKAAVLRALAESDFGGDGRVPDPLSLIRESVNPPGLLPYPQGEPAFGGLTIQDHTLIMRAIMEHPLGVLRYLPTKYKSKTSSHPSGTEVLQAALQVNQIDDYVKGRMRVVLEILPKIEEAQAAAPESLKRAVDDLRKQLANKTLEAKRTALRDAGFRSRHREDGLAEGMEIAAQILEDGQDSIYSPNHSFYKLLQEGQGGSGAAARVTFGDVSDADGVGGTIGGAMGSGMAGVGAGPGALAGAIGGSGVAAVVGIAQAAWDWLF